MYFCVGVIRLSSRFLVVYVEKNSSGILRTSPAIYVVDASFSVVTSVIFSSFFSHLLHHDIFPTYL